MTIRQLLFILCAVLLVGWLDLHWQEDRRLRQLEKRFKEQLQNPLPPPVRINLAMTTKTTVVRNGKHEPAQILPSDKGRVLVRWTSQDGEIVEQEGDTVMEAADRVSIKLSK